MVWELDTSVGGEGDAQKEEKLVTTVVAKIANRLCSKETQSKQFTTVCGNWMRGRNKILAVPKIIYCRCGISLLCSNIVFEIKARKQTRMNYDLSRRISYV